MDENNMTTPRSSMSKWIIPVTVLGLIVIAVVAFYLLGQNTGTPGMTGTTQTVTSTPGTQTDATSEEAEIMSQSVYQDGEYSAQGNYVSPGGPREVNVTVSLTDGVITDAAFEGSATDPNSVRFQGEFADNFRTEVVGRNIDDVSLTKVSGSSLTPKGFMDALEKIKAEAQS